MNQNPEQLTRDTIARLLLAAGWMVQSKQKINLASNGVAMREYQTDIGPADYVLFRMELRPLAGNQMFVYFNQNRMSNYSYVKVIIEDMLVLHNVFTIETKIPKHGGIISMGEKVDRRKRLNLTSAGL